MEKKTTANRLQGARREKQSLTHTHTKIHIYIESFGGRLWEDGAVSLNQANLDQNVPAGEVVVVVVVLNTDVRKMQTWCEI